VTGIQPVVDVSCVRKALQRQQLGTEWLDRIIVGLGKRPTRPRFLRLNPQGREVWPETVARLDNCQGMPASSGIVVGYDNNFKNTCSP
jgi:hypothetical protein